ncbi:hypothetical protein [Polynucleobacter sp. Fuers-14]|nr:hypothetical protein [Polynucleobacter sp. Fuers-14]MBU3640959.1 hypothetical protein [Polynucleobacter sp. Fuers-14]
MKKLLSCFLLISIFVGLSACGKSDEEKQKQAQQQLGRGPLTKGGF